MFLDPAELTKRARKVLSIMERDEEELVCDGLHVWVGNVRTNYKVVRQLLEAVLISNDSNPEGGCKRYIINGSGRKFLHGEKPYLDGKGRAFATMFDLLAAEGR